MAVTRDSLDGRYFPANATEWTDLLAGSGISNPSNLYLFNEASGNILDKIGAKNLTASGSLTYDTLIPGLTRHGVKTTAGVTGKMINTTFGNVNANSFTV